MAGRKWDIGGKASEKAKRICSRSSGRRAHHPRATGKYGSRETDAENGCIPRRGARGGGLAVLYGNIAQDGAIIKSLVVMKGVWSRFRGWSQDGAVYEICRRT